VDDDILNKVNLKSRWTMRNSVRDQCEMGKISQAGVSWNHRGFKILELGISEKNCDVSVL
jgi:hypothetical protein